MKQWIQEEVQALLQGERRAFLLFPVAVFVVATATHELFHLLVLEWFHCPYELSSVLSTALFQFTVKPLCQLTREQTVLMLAAGDLGNLGLGTVLLTAAAWMRVRAETRRAYLHSFYVSVIGLGVLFGVALSFTLGLEGDWLSLSQVLNMEPMTSWLLPVGIGLFALITIHFWIDVETTQKEYREDLEAEDPYHHRSGEYITVHLPPENTQDEGDKPLQAVLDREAEDIITAVENGDVDVERLLALEKAGKNRDTVVEYLESLQDTVSDKGEVAEIGEDQVEDESTQ